MPIYRIAIDAEEPWYEFEAENTEQAISIYNQLKHELVKPYQKPVEEDTEEWRSKI